MVDREIEFIVEALLFATSEPLTQNKLNLIFESDPPDLAEVAAGLRERYRSEGHGVQIVAVAGGYQLVTRPEYAIYVQRLLNRSGRLLLSTAALETLAIIAYKQPLSRAALEEIRGVDCSAVLKTLLARNLVQVRGRDEGVGRPLLYGTTDSFLEYFGLNRLADMPKLREIDELVATDEEPPPGQTDAFE